MRDNARRIEYLAKRMKIVQHITELHVPFAMNEEILRLCLKTSQSPPRTSSKGNAVKMCLISKDKVVRLEMLSDKQFVCYLICLILLDYRA